MPHPIGDKDMKKWAGYFARGRLKTGLAPLSESIVKLHLSEWKGTLVCPDGSGRKTIGEVQENRVLLATPTNDRPCSFKEIIDADAVLRFWFAKGQSPVTNKDKDKDDFRTPHAATGAHKISNNFYAPALAERIRRAEEKGRFSNSEGVESNPTYFDESDIEGLKTEVVQFRTSRSRKLRDRAFKFAHGICCVCGCDYSKVLGGRGVRVLQVHHREQLSSRDRPSQTKLSDLAVVCANCHLLLHLDRDKALTVEELRAMLNADGRLDKNPKRGRDPIGGCSNRSIG